MNNSPHTYGKLVSFTRYWMLLLSAIVIGLGLVCLIGSIRAFVSNNISSATVLLWDFIGLTFWSPFVFIFLAYLFSDVKVNGEGLQTSFVFKSIALKWENIANVKPSRPFGLRLGKKASVLIVKNGLTFFHRIYGLVYGQTNQPALVVWSQISDYDALMKVISKNRKEVFHSRRQGK